MHLKYSQTGLCNFILLATKHSLLFFVSPYPSFNPFYKFKTAKLFSRIQQIEFWNWKKKIWNLRRPRGVTDYRDYLN